MLNKLNILVICYYFPPYKRVGGRRWAKHCKYLNRMGINTHVLSREYLGSSSSWDNDALQYENKITRIKVPEVKKSYFQTTLPNNLFEKILWKMSLWTFKIKKRFKNTPSFISENTAIYFFNAAIPIIEAESINTIILSICPYKYSEVLIMLKEKYPKINIILDDRDNWEEEFDELDAQQLIIEKEFQKKVMASVDFVITPYMKMKSLYESVWKKQVYCMPHCVDIVDIPENVISDKNKLSIKIIYGGAFYKNIESNLNLIKKFIDVLSQKKQVEASFYVSIKGYEKELEHPSVKRFDFIDNNEYFQKVQESDYVIFIPAPIREYAMTSKFFELVATRKPILCFGGEDEVSKFILSHRLGYHITPENLNMIIDDIYDNITSNRIPDKKFDLSLHTFEYHTHLLANELSKLVSIGNNNLNT